MPLKAGETLKQRYRILKPLGQGGFGAVYRAEDLSLNTFCAIKENLDYWEEAQRQFEREARLLANLRHANLPRVTDYFSIPAQGQYLVMDFIEGYDLQVVLDRIEQPLAEKQVVAWMEQICAALIYLHSQNPPIIHRDVKPANIKITPSGQAMLVDFGIAKTCQPGERTTTGARAVTPGYSPVEQYGVANTPEEKTDARADVYALGATVYTLLTRHKPPESIGRVSGAKLIPPREHNPKISAHIEEAILAAMQMLAAERLATVEEFRQRLSAPPAAAKPGLPGGKLAGLNIPPMPQLPEFQSASSASSAPTPAKGGKLAGGKLADRSAAPATSQGAAAVYMPAANTPGAKAPMEWMVIPAGEFIYGEDGARLELPAFEMAKYPVTNLQYRSFLEANSTHPPPVYWKGRSYPLGKGRHPVVSITLYDAQAFCAWLGCRLPSEEEWEKAARGVQGQTYPWGEDWKDGVYCNNWESGIGGTTPVDKYPAGASPYQVYDMAGNVWEWTSSPYQGPFMNVLRGGSWRQFSRLTVRTFQRDWLTLGDSRDDIGFRCARSPGGGASG